MEIFFLLSNLSTQDNIETSAYYSGETIAQVKALKSALMEQLDRKISLPELAEQYGLSLTMLKDCFKAVYGKPVHAFRREYKMQVATKRISPVLSNANNQDYLYRYNHKFLQIHVIIQGAFSLLHSIVRNKISE